MKARDSFGNYFRYEEADFDWREKEKIRSEINTLYYSRYEVGLIGIHYSYGLDGRAYAYLFENHGFDDYNFYARFDREEL